MTNDQLHAAIFHAPSEATSLDIAQICRETGMVDYKGPMGQHLCQGVRVNPTQICCDTGAEAYQVEKPAPFSGPQSGEALERWHDDDRYYKPSYGVPRERSGAACGWALLVAALTLVGLAAWLVGRML